MGALNPIEFISGTLNFAEDMIKSVEGPFQQATGIGQSLGLVDSDEDQRRAALRAQQDQALAQLQQQQRLTERQQAQKARLERERRTEETRQANEKRQAALRRAVARQRAQFGASGVGSGAGSSEAVLLGLFEETDSDRENRERLDSLRNRALEQERRQLRRRNVLEATQTAQRNQLRRSSGI